MINFLANLFSSFFNGILKIFTSVFWFFEGIFYLFSKVFEIAIYLFEILYMLLQIFFALVSGLLTTIGAIATYNPDSVTSIYNPYSTGTSLALNVFNTAGFTVFAGVISWALYIITGLAILKILRGAE